MALAKHLLEKLVCPQSLATLIYFPASDSEEEFLFCPKSQLRYRIDEGIPLMLVSDAERLDDAACAALEARASELGS